MPVSPLSEAALWRRPRLLMPAAEEEACHAESQPGTHPGEDVLEPRKQTEQGYHGRGDDKQRDVMSNEHMTHHLNYTLSIHNERLLVKSAFNNDKEVQPDTANLR